MCLLIQIYSLYVFVHAEVIFLQYVQTRFSNPALTISNYLTLFHSLENCKIVTLF